MKNKTTTNLVNNNTKVFIIDFYYNDCGYTTTDIIVCTLEPKKIQQRKGKKRCQMFSSTYSKKYS